MSNDWMLQLYFGIVLLAVEVVCTFKLFVIQFEEWGGSGTIVVTFVTIQYKEGEVQEE
jgi:hypothetical protein